MKAKCGVQICVRGGWGGIGFGVPITGGQGQGQEQHNQLYHNKVST
jgi:hypothetical protein